VAKIRIPVEQLPPPNKNGQHVLRFRVASEDRNSISEWSKLFKIDSLGQIYPLQSSYFLDVGSQSIRISWETPSIYNTGASAVGASVQHNHGGEWKQHPSDVFISFNNTSGSNFIYWGRSSDSSFEVVLSQYINQYEPSLSLEDLDDFRIIVQTASFPAQINPKFLILDTGTVELV
jgi:hypothetical protein